MTDNELVLYRDDMLRGYDFLLRQANEALSLRQMQRLREIWTVVLILSNAVDDYVAAKRHRRYSDEFDPRYRLMYASRTPLQMIRICTHLLIVNHVQQIDRLSPAQWEAVQLMEQAERALVNCLERLWAEMKHEQERRYRQFVPTY
jgi:hypothetical protein